MSVQFCSVYRWFDHKWISNINIKRIDVINLQQTTDFVECQLRLSVWVCYLKRINCFIHCTNIPYLCLGWRSNDNQTQFMLNKVRTQSLKNNRIIVRLNITFSVSFWSKSSVHNLFGSRISLCMYFTESLFLHFFPSIFFPSHILSLPIRYVFFVFFLLFISMDVVFGPTKNHVNALHSNRHCSVYVPAFKQKIYVINHP